jgi:hypothetical protein
MSKKALLIGINYTGTNIELTGCINDITNISKVLEKFKYSCTCLTDLTTLKPTKNNIIEQLRILVSGAKAGDTILFYYSGHGSQIKDTDGDEADKLDEVLVPLDYRTQGIISDDELFNLIKIKGGVRFYGFTDCCHSGTMCDLKYNLVPNCKLKKGVVKKGMKYNPNDWTDDFTKNVLKKDYSLGTIVFISGCKDNQVSMELNKQGAFTFCFLKFLNETPIFVNNKYTLNSLLKYLQCNLQINKFVQIPQLSSNIDSSCFFNL